MKEKASPFQTRIEIPSFFGLDKRISLGELLFSMKFITSSLLAVAILGAVVNTSKAADDATAGTFQCISTKLTIADKQVDSVVQWNTKTGEARLLNAASFADKSTGQQGNLIGWVPLTDLQQAVQNLASQIQAQQAAKGTNSAPASTPIKPKKSSN